MDFFLNNFFALTATGLVLGAIYALVALGYTLVYGVLRLINFAHSEVFMWGTFASVWVLTAIGASTTGGNLVLYLAVGLLAAMAVSGLIAVGLEYVAYRPLRKRNAPPLIALISAIGASFALSEFMGLRDKIAALVHVDQPLQTYVVRARDNANMPTIMQSKSTVTIGGWPFVPTLVVGLLLVALATALLLRRAQQRITVVRKAAEREETVSVDDVRSAETKPGKIVAGALVVALAVLAVAWLSTRGSYEVKNFELFILVGSLVIMVLLDQFIRRSRLGRGIRAVAQDPEAAALMGIDRDRVIRLTFLIGGVMAGAAAFLYMLKTGQTKYNAGFILGIKAFTAAVLGGIGNLRGALLGGFVLGVAENWGAAFLGSQWQDVVSFLLLGLILMFRPTGLLGESLGRARA